MQFRSTLKESDASPVPFREAVLDCLPLGGGLYVPAEAADLRQFFLYMDEETSYPELVAAVTPALLQGELNPFSASRVAESAFAFGPELEQLDERFSLLKLYNGPSGVFKDFGIAFLAAVLEELLKDSGRAMVVSAVRGDTGVCLADSFYRRRGIVAVLLYPSGPIRGLDSRTFVQNGGNIIPIQIRGTYDECQRLVSGIIKDKTFAERYHITSANAINPGRLLPQAFYYLYAFINIKKRLADDLFFSVPSGNLGNLIAGLYAWKFGMPVNGFIAAMNANNASGDLLRGRPFRRKPLALTNSPALDVSRPSNYERLLSFYEEAPAVMRNMVYPASIDDEGTIRAIEHVWQRYHILLDPHGAVAFAAAQSVSASPDFRGHVVVLATGHPAKEAALIEKVTGQIVPLPGKLEVLKKRVDPIALIDPQIDALEGAIASCF